MSSNISHKAASYFLQFVNRTLYFKSKTLMILTKVEILPVFATEVAIKLNNTVVENEGEDREVTVLPSW